MKEIIPLMKGHLGWCVGDGKSIELWKDSWAGDESVQDRIQNLNWKNYRANLCDVIDNGRWSFPQAVMEVFSRLGFDLSNVLPPSGEQDDRVWKPNREGVFSVKSAFNTIRRKGQPVWWHSCVWGSHTHPKEGALMWKIVTGTIATDDKLLRRGFSIVS
ncbi:hypothetical protein FRX31_028192, partial [Thalictrum thalictroides]